MRKVGQQRRLPIIVREPVDIDELARRLLATTARLRATAPADELARVEVECVTAAIDASVTTTRWLSVDVKALVREVKRVLYSAEGPIEKRMRAHPRQIPTHIAIRGVIERVLRECVLP
jgi:hypothetical protein